MKEWISEHEPMCLCEVTQTRVVRGTGYGRVKRFVDEWPSLESVHFEARHQAAPEIRLGAINPGFRFIVIPAGTNQITEDVH